MFNCKSILGMGLALALGGLAQAQTPDLASAFETAREEADRPGFSGAIIILQDGQTVLEEYRGLADQSSGRANNADTRFNIASIGKFITAMAYRAAADEADMVDFAGVRPASFLPEYAELFAPQLSVGDLLFHRTTVESFFMAPEGETRSIQAENNADIFDLVIEAQDGPIEVRLDGLAYNNGNAIVTGEVIAAMTGQSYEAAVQSLVFEPANVTRAAFTRLSEADALQIAQPYVEEDFSAESMMRRGPGSEPVDLPAEYPRQYISPLNETISMAAGGLYMSAMDLARIGASAIDGTVLTREQTAELCTSGMPVPGRIFGMGCGGRALSPELTRWGHGGGAPGINSQLAIYPELDLVLVVLANHNGRATPVVNAFEAALMPEDQGEQTLPGGFVIRD